MKQDFKGELAQAVVSGKLRRVNIEDINLYGQEQDDTTLGAFVGFDKEYKTMFFKLYNKANVDGQITSQEMSDGHYLNFPSKEVALEQIKSNYGKTDA